MSRRIRGGFAILLTSLILAGCGGDSDEPTPTTSAHETTSTATEATARDSARDRATSGQAPAALPQTTDPHAPGYAGPTIDGCAVNPCRGQWVPALPGYGYRPQPSADISPIEPPPGVRQGCPDPPIPRTRCARDCCRPRSHRRHYPSQPPRSSRSGCPRPLPLPQVAGRRPDGRKPLRSRSGRAKDPGGSSRASASRRQTRAHGPERWRCATAARGVHAVRRGPLGRVRIRRPWGGSMPPRRHSDSVPWRSVPEHVRSGFLEARRQRPHRFADHSEVPQDGVVGHLAQLGRVQVLPVRRALLDGRLDIGHTLPVKSESHRHRIQHRCRRDVVAKQPRRDDIDLHAENRRQFFGDASDAEQLVAGARDEVHQHVHVTVFARVPACRRAKQARIRGVVPSENLRHVMPPLPKHTAQPLATRQSARSSWSQRRPHHHRRSDPSRGAKVPVRRKAPTADDLPCRGAPYEGRRAYAISRHGTKGDTRHEVSPREGQIPVAT